MSETHAQRLAAYFSALRPDDLPESVVEDARRRVMDTIGVALAGSRMDYAAPVHDVLAEMGGRAEATVWGNGDRLPAAQAGFVNAAYAHGPDFDDTHSLAMVHIGCLAVPARWRWRNGRGRVARRCSPPWWRAPRSACASVPPLRTASTCAATTPPGWWAPSRR